MARVLDTRGLAIGQINARYCKNKRHEAPRSTRQSQLLRRPHALEPQHTRHHTCSPEPTRDEDDIAFSRAGTRELTGMEEGTGGREMVTEAALSCPLRRDSPHNIMRITPQVVIRSKQSLGLSQERYPTAVEDD